MHETRRSFTWWFWAVLAVALALRVGMMPGRYELRDIDESGYAMGGTQLMEGVLPGYKNAPGGPVFWVGWVYTAAHAGQNFVHPTPEERSLPVQVRVFAVLERTFFNIYHDLSGVRRWILLVNLLAGLGAIWGAWRIGRRHGGVPGALAVALLAATIPTFIELGAMSRPYSLSWSFAWMALGATTLSRNRVCWSGVLMGLAVGTRIEAILLLPLMWFELMDYAPVAPTPPGSGRMGGAGGFRAAWRASWIAVAAALIVSPWISSNFLGMLRAIATIQGSTQRATSAHETLVSLFHSEGLGLASLALVITAGLMVMRRVGSRALGVLLAAYLLLMFATIFKSTGFGLHHKGPNLIVLAFAVAPCVGWLASRWRMAGWMAALVIAAWPFALSFGEWGRSHRVPDYGNAPLEWVEQHIPAGTRVYMYDGIRVPLPMPAASQRMWAEVVAPTAYERKLEAAMRKRGTGAPDMPIPRALSDENLVQERGSLRKWFMLGAQPGAPGPRYDVYAKTSQVFGSTNPSADFADHGGVLIYRPMDGDLDPRIGPPAMTFRGRLGFDTFIYVSPDVRATLSAGTLPPTTIP